MMVKKEQRKEEEKRYMKREERMNSIMNTAVSLFLKKGVAHTTMKDIADAEGISEAAVYKYFKNKQAIFEVIAEKGIRLIDSKWANFEKNMDKMAEDPYKTLFLLKQEFWNFAFKYRDFVLVLMKEFYDPNLRPIFKKMARKKTTAKILTEFFKKCQEKGKIREDIPPSTLAYFFLSASRPVLGATGYLEAGFNYSTHDVEKSITDFLKVFFEKKKKRE